MKIAEINVGKTTMEYLKETHYYFIDTHNRKFSEEGNIFLRQMT